MEEKDSNRQDAIEKIFGEGVQYEHLSAWGQQRIDRLLAQSQSSKVDAPYNAALPNREYSLIQDNERLARSNEQLLMENAELWQENQELKLQSNGG